MGRGSLIFLVLASGLSGATATVQYAVANMHSTPSSEADVVSQARFGESVAVIEASAEWLKIETPDRYSGWVAATSLVARQSPYEGNASVTSLFAHLYRERSITRQAPLMTLPFEARVHVADSGDERWLEATLPDERKVWIQRGDVELEPKPADPFAMIQLSRRFLGLPYTWGGTSSYGYDCSGFTQMLLRQRGINMPRDAHDQAGWEGVSPVEKPNLEPGDLLFFGPSVEKITHTGMYLGDGSFIHATAHVKPVIQISRLDEEHWMKTYVGARRVK